MSTNSPPETNKSSPEQPVLQNPQDVLMNAPVGIFTTTPDGRYLSVNNTLARMHGYDSPRQLMDSVTDIATQIYVDPADRKDLKCLLEKHGKVTNLECQLRHMNGGHIWVSEHICVIKDVDGNIIAYQGFNQDITERKQAEKEKWETEQKFRALIEKCPASIMLLDEQGRVEFVNDWHIEKFANNRLRQDCILGKSIHELPGLVNAGVDSEIARIYQGESVDLGEIYFPEFATGGDGWVNIRAVPIYKDDHISGGVLLRENITARKKNEIALQESRQKYRSLVETVQDIIYVHAPDGRLTYLSPQIADLLGYESQELIGKNFQDFVHPQDLPVVQGILEEVLKTCKKHEEVEHRVLHKNGQWRWFNVHASSQINSEGEIESILGVARDITGRKRSEDELRYQKQLLETIVNGTWDILSIKKPDHTVEFYNQAGYDLLGLPPEEVNGMKCFELLGRSQACSQCPTDMATEKNEPVTIEKYVPELGIYLDCRSLPVLDDQGNIVKIVQHLRDITEGKRVEEALEKRLVALTQPLDSSEGLRFEEMFGIVELQRLQDDFAMATNVAALITHPDGTAITAPTNFCRLCEIIRATEIGRANCIKSDSVLGSRNPGGVMVQPCLSGGLWDAGAAIYVGERHIANWLIGQVRDEEQDEEKIRAYARTIGADEDDAAEAFREVPAMSRQQFKQITDALFTLATQLSNTAYQNVQQARFITERKRAEEKIRLINQQLEKSNAEKDMLFTIIAHDLKSPMAGVFSTSKFLAMEAKSMSQEEISLFSNQIHKSTENTLELLDDLMQWARMSQGGMNFSPEACSLHDLASLSLQTAQDVAEKKDISIRCDIPQELTVLADQPMINTVIRNMIFNSIKFTPQNGNIYVTAKQTDTLVEICVHDEGIGMNDAILSSIFSVDKSKIQFGTDGEKGTGLGLILCKEFVEKHGGDIWLESQQGKGTKVFFTLPGAS